MTVGHEWDPRSIRCLPPPTHGRRSIDAAAGRLSTEDGALRFAITADRTTGDVESARAGAATES